MKLLQSKSLKPLSRQFVTVVNGCTLYNCFQAINVSNSLCFSAFLLKIIYMTFPLPVLHHSVPRYSFIFHSIHHFFSPPETNSSSLTFEENNQEVFETSSVEQLSCHWHKSLALRDRNFKVKNFNWCEKLRSI